MDYWLFPADLEDRLQAEVARDPVFVTLGPKRKPNRVVELTPTEMYVETDRSKARGEPAQPIPAWMFTMAWDYLRARGELSNRYLLDELRVHRSSAVCAILARLAPVTAKPGRKIELEWEGRWYEESRLTRGPGRQKPD